MININDIGYYLFMQEQEEKQKEEQFLFTANEKCGFVEEQATTKEESRRK